jgi:hypothetical protein
VSLIAFALWGALGGLAVEALQFQAAIRRAKDWPWKMKGEPSPLILAISVVIRVLLGAGLALSAAATGQISGPIGSIAVAISAILIVEQLAKQVPLDEPPPQRPIDPVSSFLEKEERTEQWRSSQKPRDE